MDENVVKCQITLFLERLGKCKLLRTSLEILLNNGHVAEQTRFYAHNMTDECQPIKIRHN